MIIAPTSAKMIWEAARRAMISGVVMKKPTVVPKTTAAATFGEMNIARKMATWEPSVKDMGPKITFGITMGTTRPIAHKIPANTN